MIKSMRAVFVVIWICAASLACLTHPNAAQSEEERPVARVGFSQFPGYSYIDQTGVAAGYSIDVIRMLLEPLGYTISFTPYQNPDETFKALERGEIDMTSLLVDTPERRAFGTFTDPISAIKVSVIVAQGSPTPASTADLQGQRVGAVSGSIGWRLLSEIEGATPVSFPNGQSLLLPLLSGEVDAIVASVDSVLYQANSANLSHRVAVSEIDLQVSPLALLTQDDAVTLRSDLNASIATALSTDRESRISAQWFGARPAPVSRREILAVMLASGFVVAVLAYWAWLHYGVYRRAKRLHARTEMFSNTLDTTGSSLIIFDKDLKPIYWNDTFKRYFPRMVPMVTAGMDFQNLIEIALQNGSFDDPLTPEAAKKHAQDQINKIRMGEEMVLFSTTDNGRILRRRAYMLPDMQVVVISTDVTELASAKRNMELIAADLSDANKRLQSFTSIAAHDLVAPLRNVGQLLEIVREDLNAQGVTLETETLDNLERTDFLLNRQKKMISDLLAYSSLEQSAKPEDFNPVDRFQSVLALANVPAGFKINLPAAPPTIRCNPIAFETVLRNLLSNAVKHHARETGEVSVSASAEDGVCVIDVSDDGPGIPPRFHSRVFEPFERLRSQDQGAGSGLGLAFVAKYIAAWGGEIQAISSQDARGTTFRFTVPLADHKETISPQRDREHA